MIATLTDFRDQLRRRGLGPEFFEHIRNHYDFYTPPVDGALVTGYYEAQVNGARKPSRKYAHPVYRTPRDLLRIDLSKFYFFPAHRGLPSVLRGRLSGDGRILPYHTREEIDSHGRLKGLGLELLWVDDPVDLFFLHIQGSGVVVFEDGSRQRIGYADSNGHPYRAIGRILIEQDKMTYENMSMQSIREYIRRHPREMQALFNENPSYIFFRPLHTGPLGSIDVPVTPLRSVATDSRLFPPGALCYLRTELPRFGWKQGDPGSPFNPFCGFVLNQDTGGAIKGPGRLDLFVGAGPRSEWIAGHMKQRGTVYFLIKKTD
jgi:membrane-bound lytic murein transglycosylase A